MVTAEPLTDKILVERAQRGDTIAFSELVNRHYRRALRIALGLVKNVADAEDVVQEAFTRVHRRLGDFEGSSAFYTWLYRIVTNLAIDSLRKRRRERRVDVEEEAAQQAFSQGNALWPGIDRSNPQTNSERSELGQQLQKAVHELPEIHQAVLLLRELEGLSYEEIATMLRIKKGTVMSRLFHARKTMQEALEDFDGPHATVKEEAQ